MRAKLVISSVHSVPNVELSASSLGVSLKNFISLFKIQFCMIKHGISNNICIIILNCTCIDNNQY